MTELTCPQDGYTLQEFWDEDGTNFLHCAICNAEFLRTPDGRVVMQVRSFE